MLQFFANGSSWGIDADDADDATQAAGIDMSPPCEWSAAIANTYLAGYVHTKSVSFKSLAAAKAACIEPYNIETCGGVVSRNNGASFEIRRGTKPLPATAKDNEASYVLKNRAQCLPPPCDTFTAKASCPAKRCKWTAAGVCTVPPPPPPPPPPDTTLWRNRSAAAYGAVTRVDGREARWIYQGYALGIGSGGLGPAQDPHALGRLHSFTSPVPEGQFILLDMSAHGDGEWHQWKGQWGLPFIWTALHDYGGDMGIKGNLSKINAIPFEAPPLAAVPKGYDARTQAVGVGYTPEGLDQNTAYYELLQEAAFKAAPEPNVTEWLIERAHRRYGLLGGARNEHVTAAWGALAQSGYAIDKGVNDGSGVCEMNVLSVLSRQLDQSAWKKDLLTPAPALCLEFASWGSFNAAAPAVAEAQAAAQAAADGESPPLPRLPETFSYDLVNTAREVLAQLSTPLLLDFSGAFNGSNLSAQRINATGALFVELLTDLEQLLSTDTAFMLGPWLASARKLGGTATDCTDTLISPDIGNCADFMEWNAKAQLTTWYPVVGSASAPRVQQGGRDHDCE